MQSFTDFDIVRANQTEPLTVFVRDPATGVLTDVASTSTFNMARVSDDVNVVTQSFTAAGGGVVAHPSTGVYQYTFDASTYNSEYVLDFNCALSDERIHQSIYVKSVPVRQFAYAAALRLQVDKARKSIKDDIQNIDKPTGEPSIQFFFGYDDKNLIFYLERGAQIINAIPPYTGFSVSTFPFDQYGSILIDAATIAALESQGIFAIDTDFSYSLGGNSLVIDHFSKLSTMISNILNRFNTLVIKFKQQFRSKGLVMYQWMPGGVRAARVLNAMPAGFWSRLLSAAYQ